MLRRIVLSFVGEPRSIGDVAGRSGSDLKRLHHHVTRLERLGLLEVVSIRRRAGRPVKLYGAVADSFFVPVEALPELFSEGLARELRASIRNDLAVNGQGVLLSVDEDGGPQMQMIADQRPDRPNEFWLVLRLSSPEVEALREDLERVLREHAAKAKGRGKQYLVHAAVAPRVQESVSVDNVRPRARGSRRREI